MAAADVTAWWAWGRDTALLQLQFVQTTTWKPGLDVGLCVTVHCLCFEVHRMLLLWCCSLTVERSCT
jgi:hypothetical protein